MPDSIPENAVHEMPTRRGPLGPTWLASSLAGSGRRPARIRNAIARYREACAAHAATFAGPQEAPQEVADAVTAELGQARAQAIRSIRSLFGGSRPSDLGDKIEGAAPQGVVIDSTLAIVVELEDEPPSLVLLDLADVEHLS